MIHSPKTTETKVLKSNRYHDMALIWNTIKLIIGCDHVSHWVCVVAGRLISIRLKESVLANSHFSVWENSKQKKRQVLLYENSTTIETWDGHFIYYPVMILFCYYPFLFRFWFPCLSTLQWFEGFSPKSFSNCHYTIQVIYFQRLLFFFSDYVVDFQAHCIIKYWCKITIGSSFEISADDMKFLLKLEKAFSFGVCYFNSK